MTDAQLDSISRSWVGHVATSPAARAAMLAAPNAEALAQLIEAEVLPRFSVRPEDIPAIRERVGTMFNAANQPNPPNNQTILEFPGEDE